MKTHTRVVLITDTSSLPDELTPAEVLQQLERILADPRFTASERNSRFLRYVVEQALTGHASEIKEVVIATDIYGKASSYDPKVDSIVRVEASRLRARLQVYYEHNGAQDPMRITIPKGTYVPVFERMTAPASDESDPEAAIEVTVPEHFQPQPTVVRGGLHPMFATLLAVVACAIVLWAFSPWGQRSANAAGPREADSEALIAWQEGNDMLREDPNAGLSEHGGIPPTLERAIERFSFAVTRDPGFANAWAGLAEAYDYAVPYVGRNRPEDARKAEAAARRAIQLDDRLAAGHAILGTCLFYLRWDFAGAEAAYRRALQLDPRRAFTVVEYADLLRVTGRLEQAAKLVREARAMQPALPVLAVKEAELQIEQQLADAAIATAQSALRLNQDFRRAHVALGAAWEKKERFDEAIRHYRNALAINRQDRRALPALGYLLGRTGKREEARVILQELEAMHARVRNCAVQLAIVHAGMGENEQAVAWVQRAFQSRQALVPYVAVDPRLAPYRTHPQVRSMLASMKL